MKNRQVAVVLAFSVAACTPASTAASGADGGPGGTDAGASTTAGSLTCIQILECAAACADNDDACSSACEDQGSADAKAKADALVDCANKNSCTDATCFQTKCKTTLDACATSRPPTEGGALSGT